MPKSNTATVEPLNNFYAGGSRRAAQLAQAVPARTATKSISVAKPKKPGKVIPMGPTPERLAKGDIDARTGFHRSVSPVERLRDQNKLDISFPHLNQAMFEAAEKLRRHFDACMVGVQAQDLNKAIVGGHADSLEGEENWVYNFDTFRKACKLMGWSSVNPQRGAGRIVVAVVCHETPVLEAALAHIGAGRTETVMGAGMDRLREGLFALATHWRLC